MDAKPSKPKQRKPGNGSALLGPENRTDAGTAKRFVDRYHDELLYVAPWKKWLAWDGRRWANDASVGVNQRAKEFSDSLWDEFVAVAKHVTGDGSREILNSLRSYIQKCNSTAGIANYLVLAGYDPRVVCQVDALNADPYLLNVANGTIDLRTGELRPHNPSDRITQLAHVEYDKSNHPTEKASLYQMRFVAISEPQKNSSLREARVKELTGERTINARRIAHRKTSRAMEIANL